MRQIYSPLDGFRSPFGRLMGGTAPFTPAVLFGASEPGVWYDPSDLTTLFQDTAGTTPVTTPGQTVALALDKSKGLVLGPELATGTPGAYNVPAGTVSVSGASVTCTCTSNGNYGLSFGNIATLGRRYAISFTVVSNAAARVIYAWPGTSGGAYTAGTTTGAKFAYVLNDAGGTTAIAILGGVAGESFTVSNISVKELPGFHAMQATLASRPTYGIVPLGGRRNLLTRTEEFNDAVWVKDGGTVTADFGTAPNGTSTADRLVTVGTGNTLKSAYQIVAAAAATHTFSVYVKDNASAARVFEIFFSTSPTLTATVGTAYNFDTDTLTNGSSAGPFTFVSSSRTSVGSGWFRISVTVSVASAQTIRVYMAGPFVAATAGNYLIWGAQLELGSSATNYQRVGSAFDVTEAGVASLSYLSFDGVDDFLITPTITPGIDKAQVFAGVRPLSTTGNQTIYATDPLNSVAGSFGLRVNTATALQPLLYGSSLSSSTPTIPSIPVSLVTTQLADIGAITGLENGLRVNGGSTVFAVNAAGTGNLSAQPLYIGRYLGTSNPFNGNLFSLIVRFGTNLDAGTITSTETWVAGKTGVTL